MMKKLISLTVILSMLCMLMAPLSSFAATTYTQSYNLVHNDITWRVSNYSGVELTEPIDVGYINAAGNLVLTSKGVSGVVTGQSHLAEIYPADNTATAFADTLSKDNFDFEMKMKYDDQMVIILYTGSHRFYLTLESDSKLIYDYGAKKRNVVEIDMPFNQWHTWTLSVRNKSLGIVSIDGREVLRYELQPTDQEARAGVFYRKRADADHYAEVEYVNITPVSDASSGGNNSSTSSLVINTLSDGQIIKTGTSVNLKTNKSAGGLFSSTKATYYCSGASIGTDKTSGSLWVTNSGLDYTFSTAGTYEIYATCSGLTSDTITVRVQDYIPTITVPEAAKYGESVTVTVNENGISNRAYMKYYVNGFYKIKKNAKSVTITDLNVGSAEIYAVVVTTDDTEYFTEPQTITVTDVDKTVKITVPETTTYGQDVSVHVNTGQIANRAYIKYYLNGAMVKKQNSVTVSLSGLSIGTSQIHATVVCTDGSEYTTKPAYINVVSDGSTGAVDIRREYMVDYEYDGASVGSLSIVDGYFALDFSHNGKTIGYKSIDGNKSYTLMGSGNGNGKFRVIVTSGSAEVYYNGQFAFSCLMPYEPAEKSFNYSGITNVVLQGSGVKAERYLRQSGAAVNEYDIDFDKFYSLEFDKLNSSAETLVVYDGEYQAKLIFDGRGIVAMTQPDDYKETYEECISDTIPTGYYRLTVARGLAQLFVNNKYINSFKCPALSHEKALLRKVTRNADSTFVSIKNTDDVYYHNEDFDGNTELAATDYWYTEFGAVEKDTTINTTDAANPVVTTVEADTSTFSYGVETADGNSYLKLWGEGDYSLNASAENPVFKFRAKWDGTGEFAVLGRYFIKDHYINLGYGEGGWFVRKSNLLGGTTLQNPTLATSTANAPGTDWNSYTLEINDKTATLYCNDAVVITYTGEEMEPAHGKLGFKVSGNATLMVDDVEYTGDCKANAGFSYFHGTKIGNTINTRDFYLSNDNETIWMAGAGYTHYRTKDGLKWERVTEVNDVTANARMYLSANNLRLVSGNFLRVGAAGSSWVANMPGVRTYAAIYGPDENWEDKRNYKHAPNSVLIEGLDFNPNGDYGSAALSGRLIQDVDGNNNRVFYVKDIGGERYGGSALFYSDDEGKTWTLAKKFINKFMGVFAGEENNPVFHSGVYSAESMIVDMPGDLLRYYTRSDRGFLYYSDSTDGGITWGEFKPSQFIAPRCSYGIVRDSDIVNNPRTYYAFWEYDTNTANKNENGGRPRNRAALAVSHDGMETWEYIMDIEELTNSWRSVSTEYNAELTPDNHSIRVINGAVYMTTGKDAVQYAPMYRVDLSKIKTLKRFTSAHERLQEYITVSDISDRFSILPKESGYGSIYGTQTSITVTDGNYSADIISKVMKAMAGAGGTFGVGSKLVTIEPDVNGNYDIKKCASSFGMYVTESQNAYVISDSPISRLNLYQLSNIGVRKTLQQDVVDEFLNEINVASEYGYGYRISELIQTYSDAVTLEIDLSGITDTEAVFDRMTGKTYYTVLDVQDAIIMACQAQKMAESGKGGLVLSSASGGFSAWKTSSSLNNDNVVVIDGAVKFIANGLFGSGNSYGTSAFTVPKSENYSVVFELKLERGTGATVVWSDGEYKIPLSFNKVNDKPDDNVINIAEGVWNRVYANVSNTDAGMSVTVNVVPIADDGTEGEKAAFTAAIYETVGGEGFNVELEDGKLGTAELRKVRVYEGKVLDVVSYTVENGKAKATVELLNDGQALNTSQLVMNVFSGNKLSGTAIGNSENEETEVSEYGIKEFDIPEFNYTVVDGVKPTIHFHLWKDTLNLQPVIEPVIISQ